MKRKLIFGFLTIFLLFSVSEPIFAYSSSSIRKKIDKVEREIGVLEADIESLQTTIEKRRAEKKLKTYKKELRQLQWDLKRAVHREKIKSDKKILSKHR